MHSASLSKRFVAAAAMGLINPIQTYPTQNFTKSALSSASLNISPESYNVSAVIQSMVTLNVAFQKTLNYYPENPIMSPVLHHPDVSQALVVVQDAIRNATPVTNAPSFPMTTSVIGFGQLGSPVVNIRNLSPAPVCYYVEFSNGKGNFPLPDICDASRDAQPVQQEGIIVPPNCTTVVYTGTNFNGPFNEIIGGVSSTINGRQALVNGTRGARHEINYDNAQGGVFYDISYEFGFSNSRLGPSSLFPFADTLDYIKQNGGQDHIQGEADILAKANAAWSLLSAGEKQVLAEHDRYLTVVSSEDGGAGYDIETSTLSQVKHDKNAPAILKYFFQVSSDIKAYVYHGSAPVEAGLTESSVEAAMRPVSDMFSYFWGGENNLAAENMTIAVYPQL